jgi:hypothetical protein
MFGSETLEPAERVEITKVDHWSWTDMSLAIFQREPDCIQISYSGGEMLKLNHREDDG